MGGFLKLNLGSEGRKGKREMKQGEGGRGLYIFK